MPRPATLPVAPFLAWAENHTRQMGSAVDAEVAMGIDTGAFTRAIYRARHRDFPMLTLQSVDRYFTAAEEPHQLAVRYPLDEPAYDRWCESCHDVVTTNDDMCCPWCEHETAP